MPTIFHLPTERFLSIDVLRAIVANQVYYEINDILTEICLRSMEIIFDNDDNTPIETLKQMIATNETANISPSHNIGAASFAKIA